MPTIQKCQTVEEWLQARYGGIGASEAAAVLGVSRFGSPWSVWRDKVDKPAPSPFELNPLTEWGHRHENAIAGKLFETLEAESHVEDGNVPWTSYGMFDPGQYTIYWADEPSWLFCTPDRLLADAGGLVLAACEIKCAWYEATKEWKTAIPLPYRIQCQVQMHCLGVERCYYAALLNGHEFLWFTEKRNQKFMAAMLKRLGDFWSNHVLANSAPPCDYHEATSVALAEHFQPAEETTITLPEEFVQKHADRLEWKGKIIDLGRKVKAIENSIRSAMGYATVAELPGGLGAYTWKPSIKGTRTLRFKASGGEDDE